MQRRTAIYFLLLLCMAGKLLLCTSCKKDLLHFQKVQQLNSYTTGDRLDRIFFVTDKIGFISGGQRFSNACILATIDGGYTWSYQTFPTAGKELYSITASPAGVLYSIGFDGKLLMSPDTGKTWQFKQIDYLPYTDMAFYDSSHAVLVGGVSFNSGLMSFLNARSLSSIYDSLVYQLNRIKFVNAQTGYECGYGAALKTTDGGNTWNFMQVKGDDFTGMCLLGNEIWMCGYNGGIFHSADGGNSWQTLRNGNDITHIKYQLQDLVFKDSQNGWAVGEGGVVIHTTDGGHNWSEYDNFTGNGLMSVALCANGDLLVAGYNGALYRLYLQ